MLYERFVHTAQKLKFSIKDFFSKCDLIRSFLRIWSLLLKKSLMVNFIFCAVSDECHSLPNYRRRMLRKNGGLLEEKGTCIYLTKFHQARVVN